MQTNNANLKEYYIKLAKMYDDAVTMLTSINQSLSTSASQITFNVSDGADGVKTLRIPSFLYLENKLEQVGANIDNIFELPASGEAWFEKASNMYKLKMVKSTTAPISPSISNASFVAGTTANNILRDMVSPKTFLRFNMGNIPDNIEKVMMKKVIVHNPDVFSSLQNMGVISHTDYMAALYNLQEGDDYEMYESVVDMPVRKDAYSSAFRIVSIAEDVETNPWVDEVSKRLNYKVYLDKITYRDQEDSSIEFALKAGDYICLGNENAIYKVKHVDLGSEENPFVIIEEYIGHITLQKFEENSAMVFQIYNESYAAYHYVDVPLEENQFIIVFLASIYNNTRSEYSDGHAINLGTIYIKDEGGNFICDASGNKLTYMDYYNKYCVNLGDLILGLSETAYPQISNYTSETLRYLQEEDALINLINSLIDNENILQVVSINKHLSDDETSESIIKLHAQKNELMAQLQTIQSNIDATYSTLISTDFSQDVTVTQESLQKQIKEYYTERTETQQQINAIVDSINIKASEINVNTETIKYRVRGVIDSTEFEKYVHEYAGEKCDIIGLDVEYKYKTLNKDTNKITTINGSTFTDWNRLDNIDKQRELKFTNSGYTIEYTQYNGTDNIIKWNQIDIPIVNGEDVVVRIRFKYNIGQPFINLYSPWSHEVTVSFPTEFVEDIEINNILESNNTDTIKSSFSKTLINDGYSEHIQNKVVSNAQTFFHSPDNIYSGFNTAENNLISLKDKLIEMVNDIDKYKKLIEQMTNSKFDVYLTYDNNQVLLSPNTINKINIYNTDHITDLFIKKPMNIVIKNTGDTTITLYSIFPGNPNTQLLETNINSYNEQIVNYERVPIFVNNELTGQTLGQCIYFRQNNPYTGDDIYLNDLKQNYIDYLAQSIGKGEDGNYKDSVYIGKASDYMNIDNKQVCLMYNRRFLTSTVFDQIVLDKNINNANPDSIDDYVDNTGAVNADGIDSLQKYIDSYKVIDYPIEKYIYPSNYLSNKNNFLLKYENIARVDEKSGDREKMLFLDENTPLSDVSKGGTSVPGFANQNSSEEKSDSSKFDGAFLFTDLLSREQISTKGGENDYVSILQGESLSIPITFEYFISGTNSTKKNISKSLYFDIRNSLVSNPIHYMIQITGNYDYTTSSDIYTDLSPFLDEVNKQEGSDSSKS